MSTKRMDVLMSDLTLEQQREIKKIDGVSLSKTRQKALADAISKLHKRLHKPQSVLDNLDSTKHE